MTSASRWRTGSSSLPPSTCPRACHGPQPCMLEALPYRKDDLTVVLPAGVRTAARRARVRRLPPRPPRHRVLGRRRDRRVPAARAAGPRGGSSTGWPTRTGATATSACTARRTRASTRCRWRASGRPQLKAIIAIYGTDDRYTDDVHYRGGILKVLDLVDYCHYMTPMNALPPVPAVWGDGWRDEWVRRIETSEPWALTWLREQLDGPYWRHGSVRPDYERIAVPDDDHRGLGGRLPQQLLPADGAAARPKACRTGCWPAPGRTRPRRPRYPGTADRLDAGDGRLVGPVAARRRQRRRRRARRRPTRHDVLRALVDPTVAGARHIGRGFWVREEWPTPRSALRDATARGQAAVRRSRRLSESTPGSTAPGTFPGGRAATSASTTRPRLTWEWDAEPSR